MKGKTAYHIEKIQLDTPWEDPFPVNGQRPAKSKFLPSKWERIKINKIVEGIKRGTIVLHKEKTKKDEELSDIWL